MTDKIYTEYMKFLFFSSIYAKYKHFRTPLARAPNSSRENKAEVEAEVVKSK